MREKETEFPDALTGDSRSDTFIAGGKNAGGLQGRPRYQTPSVGLGPDGSCLLSSQDAPRGGSILTYFRPC